MELWISRQAFKNAMEARGVDLSKATRQEMRTYVCAQCHVEYYFKGDNKILTFPWSKGLKIEEMEKHYDEYGFKDGRTKRPARRCSRRSIPSSRCGAAAARPLRRRLRRLPHALRARGRGESVRSLAASPLINVNQACQPCHKQDEQALKDRITIIQNNTAELLRKAEAIRLKRLTRSTRRRPAAQRKNN